MMSDKSEIENSPHSADDEAAIAEFLYEHADALTEPRHHDNSNIEEMLAEIAALREVLRLRAERKAWLTTQVKIQPDEVAGAGFRGPERNGPERP